MLKMLIFPAERYITKNEPEGYALVNVEKNKGGELCKVYLTPKRKK